MARLLRSPCLALAALLGGCVQTRLPAPMAPPRLPALQVPASAGTLAVLDFEDARPDFERSDGAIEELAIGGRHFARDRFWSFHAADASLAIDPATSPELRARVTGRDAFAWYPFPNHGWGKPLPAPLAIALADYVALHVEQRGLFARVVRCRDTEAARELGATLLLSGRVDHFAALLTERRDPFVVRADDRVEYRLLAGADYSVTLSTPDSSEPRLTRRCRARDDQGRLQQELEHYRGSQASPWWQLDANEFPAMAEADLTDRARRALATATGELLAALELDLAPPAAAAESS